MVSTGTGVSVAEVLPTRREPTMLTLWMLLSEAAAGVAVWAKAAGEKPASAALP
jgi:acyl-CoA reductase-like NAD-dependent aldehyde dehydrogenase